MRSAVAFNADAPSSPPFAIAPTGVRRACEVCVRRTGTGFNLYPDHRTLPDTLGELRQAWLLHRVGLDSAKAPRPIEQTFDGRRSGSPWCWEPKARVCARRPFARNRFGAVARLDMPGADQDRSTYRMRQPWRSMSRAVISARPRPERGRTRRNSATEPAARSDRFGQSIAIEALPCRSAPWTAAPASH